MGFVEGGTGVGKTFGYLVPHILAALEEGGKVLVATRTKNLQDQIFLRDLPRLARALDFRFAVLKGRENYVCASRLREEIEATEVFVWDSYARALKYLSRFDELHPTGDLESAQRFLRRYGAEGWKALREVRATDDTCGSDHRYLCRHFKALAEAEKADVIVANHHLALLWPENFPEVTRLVVDEAHALEEAATDVFSASYLGAALLHRLRRIHSTRRRGKGLLDRLTKRDFDEFEARKVVDRLEDARRAVDTMESASTDFLEAFKVERPFRVLEETITTPAWSALVECGETLAGTLERLAREMSHLHRETDGIERLRFTRERLGRSAANVDEEARAVREIFRAEPVEGTVLWCETRRDRQAIFQRAAIDVAPAIREHLYAKYRSVVLTSATLQSCGSFDFLGRRLGLMPLGRAEAAEARGEAPEQVEEERAREVAFLKRVTEPFDAGHPFDYRSNVLLCLMKPSETPDLARTIGGLAERSRGRMLALFTNRARMTETAERLAGSSFPVLAQYRDGGRHHLAARMRKGGDAILLGTRSFWEGIDVPGPSLSIVVIEKIPFTSPGDPVYDARCEALGGRWFRDYALPLALLTLRQGFGRLIRSESDTGVVVILNPGRANYGAELLRSLPECRTISGEEPEILAAVAEFFAPPAERGKESSEAKPESAAIGSRGGTAAPLDEVAKAKPRKRAPRKRKADPE